MEGKATEFAELVKSRGHEIIDGFYLNNSSELTIRCSHHKDEYSGVVAGLYKRAAFGLRCSASQSAAVSAANRRRAK